MTLKEKFVDFATDSRGVLRKLVVDSKGKVKFAPTGTKRKFVDIVHGQRMFYNPVTGRTEYEHIGGEY